MTFESLYKAVKNNAVFFVKWLFLAVIVGLVSGVIGSVFHMAVHHATVLREANSWLVFTLPVAGVMIAGIYHFTGTEGKGTNDIITSVRDGKDVPRPLLPAIFISTALTHLAGGSAGREGAALQIGGGIGFYTGKTFKLDDTDMCVITRCGMSAVFSALFGTPLTATVFSLEVVNVGHVHYSDFLPCLMASLTAYFVSLRFGVEATHYTVLAEPFGVLMLLRVIVLAVICAIASIVFCEGMHHTEHMAHKRIRNPYLRAVVGGCLIIALTLLVGNQNYNGAGGNLIADAIEKGSAPTWGFLWKMIFTAITIGFGFKGGEIVPTFFIGACLGCIVGPLLGIPAGFAAALGLIGIFCGNVNCPIASILLSVELFGSAGLLYFAVVCCIAYMLSGYFGLYKTQKFVISKTRYEAVDRFTN